MIKTEVIKYSPKAKEMALQIEKKANEMEKNGYQFISCTITGSAKAVLIFRTPENKEKAPFFEEIKDEKKETANDKEFNLKKETGEPGNGEKHK